MNNIRTIGSGHTKKSMIKAWKKFYRDHITRNLQSEYYPSGRSFHEFNYIPTSKKRRSNKLYNKVLRYSTTRRNTTINLTNNILMRLRVVYISGAYMHSGSITRDIYDRPPEECRKKYAVFCGNYSNCHTGLLNQEFSGLHLSKLWWFMKWEWNKWRACPRYLWKEGMMV